MDKMREEFERWAKRIGYPLDEDSAWGGYHDMQTAGAWAVWQHLYPMVEAAYTEGWCDGFEECADQHDITLKILPKAEWQDSTAKARLEGKDD